MKWLFLTALHRNALFTANARYFCEHTSNRKEKRGSFLSQFITNTRSQTPSQLSQNDSVFGVARVTGQTKNTIYVMKAHILQINSPRDVVCVNNYSPLKQDKHREALAETSC